MVLKNKDGSVYRLAGPNPLMNSQNLWNDQIAIHNMQWDSQKVADATEPQEYEAPETFLSSLEKSKDEIPVEKTPEKPPEIKRQELQNSDIEKVFIHCLPATIREKKDALYGDSYKTIKYSNPTSFEGVILNQEDLVISIWTDADIVGIGSILYPKTNCKNWWRVQDKQEKKNGWILTGVLSDYQPAFT